MSEYEIDNSRLSKILNNNIDLKEFTKSQLVVYQFLYESYEDIPMMSIKEISVATKVSQATVIRTIYSLGYNSFKEMREEIRCFIQKNKPLWPKLERSFEITEDDTGTSLKRITLDNIKLLTELNSFENLESYSKTIKLIKTAKRIYTLGARSSKPSAYYLYYMLHQLTNKVHFISFDSDELFDNLLDITKDDIVIAVSYGAPHYAVSTIRAIKVLNKNGIKTVLITDEISNPAYSYATQVLHIPMQSDFYSIIAVINIIDALVADIGRDDNIKNTKRLYKLIKTLKSESISIDLE